MNCKNVVNIVANSRDEMLFDVLNTDEVIALIKRVTNKQEYADKFEIKFEQSKKKGYDFFKICDQGDKIVITANSGVSACGAFNWYLKNRCNCFIGALTRNDNFPDVPPCVDGEYEESSPFVYRYFMNYCTYGYTMPFWKFDDYEKLTDWMLLSGVNLVLNPIGHETVWYDVLTELGYSQREIDNYLCGPAYLPWQWMGNMTKFGGDLPNWWYADRVELANKLNDKYKKFGVAVVLPAFCGLVPLDFGNRFPDCKLVDQGLWCNGYDRQPIIEYTDPMFDKVATLFYQYTDKHFGKVNYFSADPFHEGGKTSDIDLADYGQCVLNKMLEYNKKSIWMLQGWQENPKRAMIKDLPRENVLITNLRGDENFDAGDNFAMSGWLYCTVNNFGGVRNISGNVKNSLYDPQKIMDSTIDSTMVGVGLMMESICIDEIFFDIFNSLAFNKDKLIINDYVEKFITCRYGKEAKNSIEAFKLMANEIYLRGGIDAPKESAMCSRPSQKIVNVSTWGGERFIYDINVLKKVLELLFSEYELLCNNECYKLDLTDIARQCMANSSWESLEKMLEAYKNSDEILFEKYSKHFMDHFDIQEQLLATSENHLLGKWIEYAEKYATNEIERRMFVYNAKALISHWGDKPSSYELRDYAHKEWAGMMSDFYKPRWDAYITNMAMNIHRHDEVYDLDWFEAEQLFSCSSKSYPTTPTNNLKEVVSKISSFVE